MLNLLHTISLHAPEAEEYAAMTDLQTLRGAARAAEEAFDNALAVHFGRDAQAYARFLPPAALPAPIGALALALRRADDRLIAALHASVRATH